MSLRAKLRVLILIPALLFVALTAKGEGRRVVFIRAEIGGTPFRMSKEAIDSTLLLAQEYFNSQLPSFGLSFETGPLVTLESSYENTASAVRAACIAADKKLNYRAYATSQAGTADVVAVLFSGNSVWPQQHYLSKEGLSLRLDKTNIDCYIAFSENSSGETPQSDRGGFSVGSIAHEYAHSLGIPDFYDTDSEGSGGLSKGLWGSLSIMDRGYLNDPVCPLGALEMQLLSLGQCDTLKSGFYTLPPFDGHYLILPCATEGEYFLFENRDGGLLVLHIDRSENAAGYSDYYHKSISASARWSSNEVNARPDRQCALAVEANPEAEDASQLLFPNGESQTFCSDRDPMFRDFSGNPSPLALRDIHRERNGSVSFEVIRPIIEGQSTVFQNQAALNFDLDESVAAEADSCIFSYSQSGKRTQRLSVTPSSEGHILVQLNGLESGAVYSTSLCVYSQKGDYSIRGSFTTVVRDERIGSPLLYFPSEARNLDGSFIPLSRFALLVYNAEDGDEIEWFFEGNPVRLDSEGLFTVREDGELRAVLHHGDGSAETIVKQIITSKEQ